MPGPIVLGLAGILASVPTPVRLPADVDDAYALKFNPAGLGFIRGNELRLLYGRDLPERAPQSPLSPNSTHGLAVFGAASLFGFGTFAGSFELEFPPSGRTAEVTTLGAGFGAWHSAIGLAWEHRSPDLGRTTNVLSSGITLRLTSWLAAGVQVHDWAQKADRRTYDLGLAIHPFSDRILLSSRWRLRQSEEVFGGDHLDLAGRIEIEPLDGIFLGAGTNYVRRSGDDELGVTAQIRLALSDLEVESSVEDTTRSTGIAAEIAVQSPPRPSLFSPSRLAVLDLEGDLVPDPTFDIFSRRFEVTPYGAVPLLLDEMLRSDRVQGVYLRIASLSVGWAKAEEIRDGVLAIRATGRRVDCELSATSDLEYFIASACTSIIMAPAVTLEVNGLAANVLFFADALDKIGLKVEVVARGKYKSTPEQFTRSGMSAAQREALTAYIDTVYGTLVEGIASGRKLERNVVEEIVARGTLTATEAVAAKIVDTLLYPDEIDQHMNRIYGRTVSYMGAAEVSRSVRPQWSAPPRIAVVHVDAAISGGESRDLPFGIGQTAGAETVVGALDAARLDPSVVAVVLRVDSPGGDSIASDLIARSVQLLGQQKPVIASFGDVAASGGYYIAAPARAIYAEPATLTGSIGVFSMKVSGEGLLSKIGIGRDSIERGPLSSSGSFYTEMTPEERAGMEKTVDDAYQKFLDVVAKGRNKKREEIREVAEGRIWSGENARGSGLVDELGGFVDAIRRARTEAHLDAGTPVELVTLPHNREPLPDALRTVAGAILPGAPAHTGLEDLLPHEARAAIGTILERANGAARDRPLALVPFVLDID